MIIRWRIELLGGLQLLRDEVALPEATRRATGQLLAYLAYHQSQPQSRESLAALLWPDADTPGGLTSLRVLLTRLRTRLGGDLPLKIERQSLQLDTQHAQVDVAQFEQAVRRSRTAETPELRQAALEEALALYSGPLTPRLDDSWATAARFRLESALCHVCLQLAPLYEEQGRFDDGILVARRAIAVDELREEAHRALMRILLRQGDHAAAHRHYEGLSELLREKARSAPSPATRALLLTPAPLRADTPTVDALPTPLTTFFGREGEQEALLRLLRAGKRLVTITGPGGVGKTRFSLLVARSLGWERALHWAPLADLSPGASLDSALLGVLGGASEPGVAPLDTLKKLFGAAPSLLILDNLEHLPESDLHALIVPLLKASPNLSILATSRKALHLSFEQVFPLPPLPVPEEKARLAERESNPSVQLFVDRARLLNPGFTATDSTAIAALCRRLDGLPLAIEMAAARTGVATPSQILERLGSGSKFLVSPGKDVPARHESLHAMLAWSYALLSNELQDFLCEISIFRGSFDLEEATDVSLRVNSFDLMQQLEDISLVQSHEIDNIVHFYLLETVKEFTKEVCTIEKTKIIKFNYSQYIIKICKIYKLNKLNNRINEIFSVLDDFIIQQNDVKTGLLILNKASSRFSTSINIQIFLKYLDIIKMQINNLNIDDIIYVLGLFVQNLSLSGSRESATEIVQYLDEIINKTENPDRICGYFLSKGLYYTDIDINLSIHYHSKGLILAENHNIEDFLKLFNLNLGCVYMKSGSFKEALYHLNIVKQRIKIYNDPNFYFSYAVDCESALVVAQFNDASSSLPLLTSALNGFLKINNKRGIATYNIYQSFILSISQNSINCIDFGLQGLKISKEINHFYLYTTVFESFARYFLISKNYYLSALFLGISETKIEPIPNHRSAFEKERLDLIRNALPMGDPEILAAWQLGKSMNVHEAVERVLSGEISLT